MARYVSSVLAVMCTSIGGHDFTDKDILQKEILIGQMSLPDVLYAYVWIRVQAMGEELDLNLTSPYSKSTFDWVGDLRTVMVKSVEKPGAEFWTYTLRNPFEIRKTKVSKLVLGPQTWNVVEELNPGTATDATVKVESIKSAIYSVPEIGEGPIMLMDSDLAGMGKRDIEGLARAIDLNGMGPIMQLEVEDPTIPAPEGVPMKTFLTGIDWKYDHFFVGSSR
jgi:hypothetical protein